MPIHRAQNTFVTSKKRGSQCWDFPCGAIIRISFISLKWMCIWRKKDVCCNKVLMRNMQRLIVETCSDPSMKTFHRHLSLWFTCTSLCAALNTIMHSWKTDRQTDRQTDTHTHTHTHMQDRSSFQSSKWPSRSINKMSLKSACLLDCEQVSVWIRYKRDIRSDLVLEHVQPHFHLKPSFSFSIMFYMNVRLRDPG